MRLQGYAAGRRCLSVRLHCWYYTSANSILQMSNRAAYVLKSRDLHLQTATTRSTDCNLNKKTSLSFQCACLRGGLDEIARISPKLAYCREVETQPCFVQTGAGRAVMLPRSAHLGSELACVRMVILLCHRVAPGKLANAARIRKAGVEHLQRTQHDFKQKSGLMHTSAGLRSWAKVPICKAALLALYTSANSSK